MARYLKRFGTEEEYNSFAGSDKFVLPNVSSIERPSTLRRGLVFNPLPYIPPTPEPEVPEVDPANGYEYVDLGLPSGTLWAKCNIGAEKESDYGLYFAWGEVEGYNSGQVGSGEGKKYFNWSNYKYCNGTYTSLTKYCTYSYYGTVDNLTTLEPCDDAATVTMGGSWRMPSNEEYNELLSNTTKETHSVDGVSGRLFTSKINNNTLFFPLSGRASEGGIYETKEKGLYWSCSLKKRIDNESYCLTFNYSGACLTSSSDRYYGYAIRGVIG